MIRIQLKGVSRHFGGLKAVSDVSFATVSGEVFGVIGPNGAGKTTLFNVIAGVYRPSLGQVLLDGVDISGRPPHEIVSRGLARSFQMPRLFKGETVAENLMRAERFAMVPNPVALFAPHGAQGNLGRYKEVAAILGLSGLLEAEAGSLAYGQQKILGIGLAVATGPRLLLMDEPAAGLNPTEKRGMAELILKLRSEFGIDIIVIEHDMRLMMDVCDRLAVLNHGKLIALGSPAEVQSNPDVVEAYLGQSHETA